MNNRLYEQVLAGVKNRGILNEGLLVESFLADIETRVLQLGGKAAALFKKHPAIFTAFSIWPQST